MNQTTAWKEPDPSLITVTQVTYALHALGLAIGAFGTASVVGTFLFGWPSIIAVIINYVKRPDARGTWLESHFTWQIRTFWFAMLWAAIVVILGALLAIGAFGAASVLGSFLFGWPSIIAVVLSYVFRGDARGTWLESHFRWQIRTFWFGALWALLCWLFVFVTIGIGLLVVWIPFGFLTIWFIYRIARGWNALSAGRAMPVP